MADRVKGAVCRVLFLDGERVDGVYGTKEAASEAAMLAGSFAVRSGHSVQVNALSDACALQKSSIPGQREWIAFMTGHASRTAAPIVPRSFFAKASKSH